MRVQLAWLRMRWQAPSVAQVRKKELQDVVRRQLYQVLARRALQWESGSAVVAWANSALAAGWDCMPIAILAGLDTPPNEFEIDRYLRKALDELNIQQPERGELVRVLALTIAEDIVSGAKSPKDGCRELFRLCWTNGYPNWLMEFCAADDELALAEQGIYGSVDDVSREIMAAAQRLVASEP